jgi:hypothetical protein
MTGNCKSLCLVDIFLELKCKINTESMFVVILCGYLEHGGRVVLKYTKFSFFLFFYIVSASSSLCCCCSCVCGGVCFGGFSAAHNDSLLYCTQ